MSYQNVSNSTPHSAYNGDDLGVNLGGYATFAEAYPMTSYGLADEACVSNAGCMDGLQCMTSRISGAQTCRAPVTDHQCSRSKKTQKCERFVRGGDSKECPDKSCPPAIVAPKPRSQQHKCKNAVPYNHLPSGASWCLYIDNHTGAPEQMPHSCCDKLMATDFDFEEEYIKFAVSPQYYGTFR